MLRGVSARLRRQIAVLIALFATCFAVLGLLRFHTFHNQTFDLAFYTRMAWGIVHGNAWDPIVNAAIPGLHVSPILIPLGALGIAFGTANTLIVAQAAAMALAAWPVATFASRRFGSTGALAGALVWLLYPNLSHVATDEFHPGSVAVLPLCWALDALNRRDGRQLVWSVVGVLACREDLALITAIIGFFAWSRGDRRLGIKIGAGSLAYLALFVFVLHPMFRPMNGSLEAHFGTRGDTVAEIAWSLLSDPGALVDHLGSVARVFYLPIILIPLCFMPILRPQWLLFAAPPLLINLLSEFPRTTELSSHYLTPAVPALAFAAVDGSAALAMWIKRDPFITRRAILAALTAAVVISHALLGGTPLSSGFEVDPFVADGRSHAAVRVVSMIPSAASVQAPYELMPHLAERLDIYRAPPPERRAEFVVLSVPHRRRYHHDETLLRTAEEPEIRRWQARTDHALVSELPPYLVLRRNRDPRSGFGASQFIVGHSETATGVRLCACLMARGASINEATLTLRFVAAGPCDSDLAIRIGRADRPHRTDLLFRGLLSPVHIRAGDLLESPVALTHKERVEIARDGLRIGVLRSSGARPEPDDPISVLVPVSFER